MNKAFLIGNLTKDPEYTTTLNGIGITRFTIAVSRKYENANGERETDFINCVAWRGLADNIYKYLKKGKKCCVVGSIQTRSYDAEDGSKRYVTEINCEDCEFLSPAEKTAENNSEPNMQPIDDDGLPF